MPVILKPETYSRWLDPGYQDVAGLREMLAHGSVTDLVGKPVSSQVNRAAHDLPENIRPLEQLQIEFRNSPSLTEL